MATLYGGGEGVIVTNWDGEWSVAGDESPNRFRLLFANNNQGRSPLILGMTSVRIVCMNTLAMGKAEVTNSKDGYHFTHTESINSRVEDAQRVIRAKFYSMSKFRDRIRNLAQRDMTINMVKTALDRIYPIGHFEDGTHGFTLNTNVRDEVIRQFESGETAQSFKAGNNSAWKFFNALTYRTFNPTRKSKITDRAHTALSGSIGSVGNKVFNWFTTIEDVTRAA